MDVTKNKTNSTNSTKLSNDGGHIVQIIRKVNTTTRSPHTYRPHNSNRVIEASLGGYGNGRAPNSVDYINRLRRILNSSRWNNDDITFWYSPPPTTDYSKLFKMIYKQPVLKTPTYEAPVRNKQTPLTALWVGIIFVIGCIICALRVMAYAQRAPDEERSTRRRSREERSLSITSLPGPQENNNANVPLSVLVNSESSPQRDTHPDPPPPYFECAASNDGVINKSFDVTCEDVPPPYSTCFETSDDTNYDS